MKKAPVILFLIAFIGFIAGLVHLFHLRFETGDSYPPYSSLRADPLGTKALFESLETLVETRRNLHTLAKLADGRDTTLFWLGAEPMDLRFVPADYERLETFIRSGGRLVISLTPTQRAPRMNRFATGTPGRPARITTNAPPIRPGEEFLDPDAISIRDRWQMEFDYAPLSSVEDQVVPEPAVLRQTNAATKLPRSLAIHTATHFGDATNGWETIYARVARTNVYPVVIERRFGRGSIVLCADSYHFSNEALRRDREPQFIAWSVGGAQKIRFDETHLGVTQEPGVAALLREYRLGGVFIALLVLAGLFVWQNSVSFMPPYEEQLARERAELVEGKDSATGFINLLKRNIVPADLMKVCIEQWNTHVSRMRRPSTARLDAMQQLIDAENQLDPRSRNPVRMYREFCEILKRRH
ncbi:MAG: DUF4350 domain-containing protein [Verrucomicrobia bacterium]|nr:DUF4350 domain-containing protein [Verrucomicrobiota bacterium]